MRVGGEIRAGGEEIRAGEEKKSAAFRPGSARAMVEMSPTAEEREAWLAGAKARLDGCSSYRRDSKN